MKTLENTLIIRIAGPDDLPDLFQLVDEYSDGIKHNPRFVKNSLRDLLYIQGVLVGDLNGHVIGGVAGIALPCMWNDDVLFSVMFFYIRNRYRHLTRCFINELEHSLLPTKATKLVFGVPNFGADYEPRKRFMRMLGYRELETHMVKNV